MSETKDDNDILKEQGREGLDPMADLVPLHPTGIAERLAHLEQCRLARFYGGATAQMLARARGHERPLSLPWTRANIALGGGLWPGLHILVGNTGAGKSQWALQVALHAANSDNVGNSCNSHNVPVLYIGLELGHTDLVARLLGLVTNHRWSDLYLGKNEAAVQDATHAGACLHEVPFYLEVAPPMGWDYQTLYHSVAAMRHLYPHGPLLVVVDYLQLVAGEGADLRQRIGRASYQARAAARDFDAVVLMLSSTARENYARLNGEDGQSLGAGPTDRFVGLGKEAGEIEYAADSVLVLAAEPPEEGESSPSRRRVFLVVAKRRAGRPGWVPLEFDGSRFFAIEESPATENDSHLRTNW